MPGKGTPPGPALYPECGLEGMAGIRRHERERTPSCAGCRAQRAAARRRQRIRAYVEGPALVPALGSQRRIRALSRVGWPLAEVGARVGVDRRELSEIHHRRTVRRGTAQRITRVYGELAWRPGPSDQVRRLAERKRWPGPLDWDNPDDPREVPAGELERQRRAALRRAQRQARAQALSEGQRQQALAQRRRRRQTAAA